MKPSKPILGFALILLTLFQHAICARQTSDEAYVTLLYGDEFLLGVRVLGKSIRQTGSTKDMVVLVSDGVSDYTKKLLQADGWRVELISLLANPNQVRPTRFWGVYTKLKIFNMTTYKKVVYLDADTIVVKSIDDLFKCSKFCANLKHSERLNSGVMVVEPSQVLFNDMMTKVKTLHSYTGGDQGFLNSYYADFPNAHLFEPDLPQHVRDSRPAPAMERLSTLYNADVGLYMLANKVYRDSRKIFDGYRMSDAFVIWMVDEKELRVIHYTLGPLKPWDWWTSWLLKPVDAWQIFREQLEDSLPGTGGGRNPNDELLVKLLFMLPLIAVLFCYYRSFLQTRSFLDHIRHMYYRCRSVLAYSTVSSSPISSSQQFSSEVQSKVPVLLGGLSVFVCFVAALVSIGVSLLVVPRQVMPWTGLFLMYEWTFAIFFVVFGSYLHLVYQWGRMNAYQSFSSQPESSDYDYGKGHRRQESMCDVATCYYGIGMAVLAIAAPALPCLFGVTALFLRLGLMFVGGLILAGFMTYASEHLGTRSFCRGLQERDIPLARSMCMC